ncbi:MAG: arginine deiminase-related protein [Planctomycetota bacterium]|nr:arginine deiminase-related protein [Planctomycetota bacterium]
MYSSPTILMCPPTFYGIEYEINPWMDRTRVVDTSLATRQWEKLHALILECGAEVELVDPVEGLPDMVFTANAALIYRSIAILSQFRHTQRQGEEKHWRKVLADNQFRIEWPAENMAFEGAGDALFCGDTLFAGYRIRSDATGHQGIAEAMGIAVTPLELVDNYFYHLDTCFCPLSSTTAIYYPGAFDEYGQKVLAESIPELIEVEQSEAQQFACNAVVIGKQVITSIGCPRLHSQLTEFGWTPIETELGEFIKAGGSAKCLTLRLDGEEAAGWKP